MRTLALCVAAGLPGCGAARLGLDPGVLLLVPARPDLFRRLLGLRSRSPRSAVVPIYFSNAVYQHPGYTYSPSVVIDSGLLTFYLFARPSYHHYYFGDYYAANYSGLGIYPWFGVRGNRNYAYDPLFSYYERGTGVAIPNGSRTSGIGTRITAHPDLRPPHDLAAQRRLAATLGNRPDRQFLMAADTCRTCARSPVLAAASLRSRRRKRPTCARHRG